jgi:hypothetical protein
MITDVNGHLEVPRLPADLAGIERPERPEIVVDLVPKIFNHDGLVLCGELVPFLEAGWRVSPSALAVPGGGLIDRLRLLAQLL